MPSLYPYALTLFTIQDTATSTAWNASTTVQAAANFDNRPGGSVSGTPATGIMLELYVGFTVAPAASSAIGLWMSPLIDGSNAAAYNLSNVFQKDHFRGRFFTLLSQTAPQRLSIEYVPLQPLQYVTLLLNYTGQQISAGWGLRALPIGLQFG